jgi:hypothetical protein
MFRLAKIFLWTLVFVALLLAIDQFFLRVPATVPAHVAVRQFYIDLRGRMGLLLGGERRATVESVIEQIDGRPAAREARPAPLVPAEPSPRYLYVDAEGQLQFADSLEEVPSRFRREARPLDQ